MLSDLLIRMRALFRRNAVESELDDELRFHFDQQVEKFVESGLPLPEARRRARLAFGGSDHIKEECRDARGVHFMEILVQDIRYAMRTLRKNLTFTAMVVLSLALGIGVNLSIFVSLYFVVLHPFPYPNLDRIMTVSATRAKSPAERDAVAPADYLDWKQASRAFESLAAYEDWDANLTGVDQPDHIRAARTSAEFFEVLGVHPLRGRTFAAAECEPGQDAVVVVSYTFWQTRLASRPDAVGQTLSLGGRKYGVIGVMPEEFNLPLASELWAPLSLTPEEQNQRGLEALLVIGKLKPGVSPLEAGAEMDGIARGLEKRYPQTNEERRVLVASLREVTKSESDRFVLVLTAAALFVLLLACTNVGSLQLARTMGRQREIGLRSALGASLSRILRQLLTESLILGMAGGALGLALAAWDLNIVRSTIPVMVYRFVPGLRDMRINSEVIILEIVLSLAAGVLCCVPAIFQLVRQATAADVNEVLKEGGRSANAAPSRSRLRTTLVIAEVAIAFVLLVGAGLMVGTFKRMVKVDLGYDPENVLTGEIALYGDAYRKPAKIAGFYEAVLGNLGRLPNLQAVAASGGLGRAPALSIEGRAQPRPGEPRPEVHSTTAQYLQAMRIPLLKGRWIAEGDGPESPRVVVLSASVVRHYWPAANPIGQRIKLGNPESAWLTVVGVTGDVNDWFLGDPIPAAYVSYQQFPQASMQILVRTSEDPRNIANTLRLEAQAIDREQPIYNIHTLQQQIYEETSGVRNAARMMIVYAVIALLLAVTGIYSISSFFVAQRTREIGVRMSLGATPQAIMKMVLSQCCVMSGIGVLIGLPLAILLTVGMSHILYNLVTVQPVTFVLVVALLGALATLAGYLPAYRAARVDPMVALRHE
jgi:putative ABC transport system permease protein